MVCYCDMPVCRNQSCLPGKVCFSTFPIFEKTGCFFSDKWNLVQNDFSFWTLSSFKIKQKLSLKRSKWNIDYRAKVSSLAPIFLVCKNVWNSPWFGTGKTIFKSRKFSLDGTTVSRPVLVGTGVNSQWRRKAVFVHMHTLFCSPWQNDCVMTKVRPWSCVDFGYVYTTDLTAAQQCALLSSV